jgi:hypothetical protein
MRVRSVDRLGDGLTRRIYVLLGAMAALLAAAFGPAVGSASASGFAQGPPAGPTSPPFFQCPAIGLDTTCQFLVDVTNSGTTVFQDASQHFYDGNDDVTVAIQNDTTSPLGSVHLGVANSGDSAFSFDGDGLCNPGSGPSPDGCPFGPPGNNQDPFDYFGPDTVLAADPGTLDSGTVAFTTALQPGQYTYVSLEAPPVPNPYLAAGEVNDIVTSELTSASVEPGAVIALSAPADVTDKATIQGPNAPFAEGSVTYKVYSDPTCKTLVGNGGTKNVAAGAAEPSNPVGAVLANNAVYYWVVEYTGNAGEHPNAKTVSACGNEIMTFGTPIPPPGPTVATVLSGGGQVGPKITVPPGTAVTDTATIVAPGGQPVTGRLSYEVYTTPSCTPGTQIKGAGGGLTTGSGPVSNPLTLAAGTYYFQAAYSGNGALGPAVSPCGSEVLTVTPPSPPPPPPPSSQFTSVGNPQVNTTNGQIVVIGQFPAAGTATSTGTVAHGATLARLERLVAEAAKRKSKKCRRGFVKKKGKCVSNGPVLYGSTTLPVPAPGTYSIVISPSGQVLKALETGKALNVIVSTTFQNRAGGAPVTHVQDVVVKLKAKKSKKHGHRKH